MKENSLQGVPNKLNVKEGIEWAYFGRYERKWKV